MDDEDNAFASFISNVNSFTKTNFTINGHDVQSLTKLVPPPTPPHRPSSSHPSCCSFSLVGVLDPAEFDNNDDEQQERLPLQLQRLYNTPCPTFDPQEDVMLCPSIFHTICQNFEVAQLIDLFASSDHHKLPIYVTSDPEDTQAIACNAFDFYWDPVFTFYANPPWYLLAKFVDRICEHRSKVLLVTPDWPGAGGGVTLWTELQYGGTSGHNPSIFKPKSGFDPHPDGAPCFP